jgi:hypothetical protein
MFSSLIPPPDGIHADIHRRQPGNSRVLTQTRSLEDSVDLRGAGVTLPPGDLYDRIRFGASETPWRSLKRYNRSTWYPR